MEKVKLKSDNSEWWYFGTDGVLAVIAKEPHLTTITVELSEIIFINHPQ